MLSDMVQSEMMKNYKQQILDKIQKSPGYDYVTNHYPEIQQFIKDKAPIKVFYDECSVIVDDLFGRRHVYRNPFCTPEITSNEPNITIMPTAPDNECAAVQCLDKRVITTVRVNADDIFIPNPRQTFQNNADAQAVANAEYERAEFIMRQMTNVGNFPSITNVKVTVDNALARSARQNGIPYTGNGFQPHVASERRFKIATKIGENITISDDEIEVTPAGDRLSKHIEYSIRLFRVEYDYAPNYPSQVGKYHVDQQAGTWLVTRFKNPICELPKKPPPPPKKEECDCMSCCPQFDDTLLKLILKIIGSLPVNVPTSYLTKNGVQPAQIKKVDSLTEFITWFAERFDETVGEFEITIEVDDADLTKEGKQKETIRLPNLAESIAEMFSLMIHSNINNELILNIVNRTLIESGQIKQSELKNYSALNALIDYIGFHTNSEVQQMPLSFTVGEKSFDKFLKESQQDVSILTYHQKETLIATMQPLLQAAAIIRAVHYRRTPGTQQKIASTIKNDLVGLLGETGKIDDLVKDFIAKIKKVNDDIDNKPNQ